MPQTPQSDPAEQARTDREPDITQEEDVPSEGKDEQGEQMMNELRRDKPSTNFSDLLGGKE